MHQANFVVDDILIIFVLLFFRENSSRYFMWIGCLADNSHETSRLIIRKIKK